MKLYTLDEAAEQAKVSTRTFRRRVVEAKVQPVRTGRAPLFTDQDITTVVEASRWRARRSVL